MPRSIALLFACTLSLGGCGEAEHSQVLHATVNNDGRYTIEGRSVSELDLQKELRELRAQGTSTELRIVATERARYGDVGKLIIAAQHAGIQRVGFVNEPPQSGASPAVAGSGPGR